MMDYLIGISLVICIASSYLENGLVYGISFNYYNVRDFGAKGDGHTDDSKAFLKAFGALCGDNGIKGLPTLIIPHGDFLLSPSTFKGPCNSSHVNIKTGGSIIAPNSLEQWTECYAGSNWITFININGLHLHGKLFINGHGEIWWNKKEGMSGCPNRPTNLRFQKCDNLRISGIKSINSPRNHISISNCDNVRISSVFLFAPEKSPNTDGINIASSTQIDIRNSSMATGDDCIAINSGCAKINITNVACGPGHGISVGSLGKGGSWSTVEDVHVERCTFTGTTNGARIKTWRGGSGYARRITYNNIKLIGVANPIFIDQDYCIPAGSCGRAQPSAVVVSDVTFSGFNGSSVTKEAIKLQCSEFVGCKNVALTQVHLISSVPGKALTSVCENVNGKSSYTTPKVPCLSG